MKRFQKLLLILISTSNLSVIAAEGAILKITTELNDIPCDVVFSATTVALPKINRSKLSTTTASVLSEHQGTSTLTIKCPYERKVSITVSDNLIVALDQDVSSAQSNAFKYRFNQLGAGYIISLSNNSVKTGDSTVQSNIATNLSSPENSLASISAITSKPFSWATKSGSGQSSLIPGTEFKTDFTITPVLPKVSKTTVIGGTVYLSGSVTATIGYI